jgi:hypothetical protein
VIEPNNGQEIESEGAGPGETEETDRRATGGEHTGADEAGAETTRPHAAKPGEDDLCEAGPEETEDGQSGGQDTVSRGANVYEIEALLRKDPHNKAVLIEASRYYHRFAMTGDHAAFEKADGVVATLLSLDRANAEALAISGSLLTIRARRTPSLLRRIYYAFRAARRLDKAVKVDPANVTARTIRAFTALVLPSFLRRQARAIDDFEYLIRLKAEKPSGLPDEMMPKVYLNLGLAYAKSGHRRRACEVLAVVTEKFPGTRESSRAQNLLTRLS